MTPPRSAPLPADEVRRRAATELPDWSFRDGRLSRTLAFPSYMEGVDFVREVARIAEAMDHHPDMTLGYRRVDVAIWSHDAGGVTQRDFALAAQIDALVAGGA